MKHETKLGIAFIGILLTAFSVLLMKKLSRPGNAGLSHAQPTSTAKTEPAPNKLAFQHAPPTLVTPKAESSKPPESGVAETAKIRHENNPWSTKTNRPAELSAAPLPIAEVGDRYAANKARDPIEGAPNSAAAQPYHSGYPTTNDEHLEHKPESIASAEEYPSRLKPEAPAREKIDSYSHGGSRYGDTAEADLHRDNSPHQANPSAMQPSEVSTLEATPHYRGADRTNSSESGLESKSNADRYTAMSRTPEVYPIATSDAAAAAQRFSSGGMPVTTTGTIIPAAGIQRDGDQYTVQPNDSFWSISEKAYGNGAFFKALYEHNRKRHPEADEMKVGQVLSVPDEAVLRRAYPDLCPKPHKQMAGVQQRLASASSRMRGAGRVYSVEDGDTLFEIARRELGKTSRWAEIYDLNRDVLGNDFDYLHPGLELILPDEKPHSDNMTRQPEGVYPR